MNMLPSWEAVNEKDHQLISDALSIVQTDVSLALTSIQAQLWMQLMTATITREGEETITH